MVARPITRYSPRSLNALIGRLAEILFGCSSENYRDSL